MWWEHHRGAEQIEEFVERRRARRSVATQATSVKLMMDGVLENFTGAMLEPYGDGHGGATDNRGLRQIDPEGLRTWVPQLDALGFQPHFHAIGDRAVRDVARRGRGGARGERPIRHAAAHRPHPGHPPGRHRRASGTLDVVANAQPLWAATRTRWTC